MNDWSGTNNNFKYCQVLSGSVGRKQRVGAWSGAKNMKLNNTGNKQVSHDPHTTVKMQVRKICPESKMSTTDLFLKGMKRETAKASSSSDTTNYINFMTYPTWKSQNLTEFEQPHRSGQSFLRWSCFLILVVSIKAAVSDKHLQQLENCDLFITS